MSTDLDLGPDLGPDLVHDEVRLVLHVPVDELRPPVRRTLQRWLWGHGIAPADLAVGRAIERDDATGTLVWRERDGRGGTVKRWRFAPVLESGVWPAPFPACLCAGTARDEAGSA